MSKLEDKPYALRAVITVFLFMGFAGLCSTMVYGPSLLAVVGIALGFIGSGIWKASDALEKKSAQSSAQPHDSNTMDSKELDAASAPPIVLDNASAQPKTEPESFSDAEVAKLRAYAESIPLAFGEPTFHPTKWGYMYNGSETLSYGYHDEHESNSEWLLFRRPGGFNTLGVPLEAGDERIQKLAFITSQAKSATILNEHGRYHIIAEEFLGIPGTTIIDYEKSYRKDSYQRNLL